MSTIEDVRAAEKKVQEVLVALKKTDVQEPNPLDAELRNATDEYVRAVRQLDSKCPLFDTRIIRKSKNMQ
jgi:hypothetical protein